MPKVKVKAAVLERSRRSTAGKRMASLVGKAQDDDDAFWSHSIWSEAGGGFSDKKSSRKRRRDDDDSPSSSSSSEGEGDDDESISDGEGSYRMSEDDSDAAVDQFDSDFDESETDDEDGPIDGDGEEEKELRAEERREKASKRKKNQRLGVPLKSSSAGRDLLKRKGGAKMTKRGPLGEGWNEGLVLNWPPPSPSTIQPAVAKIGVAVPNHSQIQSSNSKLAAQGGTESSTPMLNATQPQHTSESTRTKEIATKLPPSPIKSNLNTTSIPAIATSSSSSTQPPFAKPNQNRQTVKQQRQAATTERKKSQRRQFTQEELILESIKSTETDNAKWLSARKRSKEEAAQLEKATVAKKSSLNQKPISRFHSRRGCVNTLTFMDMDHLPEILTRKQTTPSSLRSNVGISTSPRRRRVNSKTSETSESAHAAKNTEATTRERKCIITGKVARYKDPKTKQYYHDLDAYKELQRRFESGEIKIPQPQAVVVHKNSNSRKRKSDNGSNAKKANGLRGGNANVAATSPLASEQPTMVADMASNPSVKVTVTQNGIPVSPPSSAQKVPIETQIPVEASQDDRNGPPPILPTGVDKMEMKTEEHKHIHKVVNANAKSDAVSTTLPIDTKRAESQPQPSPKNVDFEDGLQDGKKESQIAKDAVDDKNKSMSANETQPAKHPTIEAK